MYNSIQFTQVQAFTLGWQGSPRRIIIPSAGQIEVPPSLSHPDSSTLSRGALWWSSWLHWSHKHASSLLHPIEMSSPCEFSKVSYKCPDLCDIYLNCWEDSWGKALKDGWICSLKVQTVPRSHWLNWGLLSLPFSWPPYPEATGTNFLNTMELRFPSEMLLGLLLLSTAIAEERSKKYIWVWIKHFYY